MKIIISLIAIFASNLLFGQLYPIIIPDSAGLGSIVELPNCDILINNYVNDSINATTKSILIKLNPKGNIIKTVKMDYPIADICPISNDSIILLYSIPNSSKEFVLYSRLIDSNFNTISTDSIKTDFYWHFKSKLKHFNNKIYFYSSYNYGNRFAYAIGQISRDGYFKDDYKFYLVRSIGPFDLSVNNYGNINLFFGHANIVKLNSKYEYIEHYTFNDTNFVYDYNTIISPNNTFITSGSGYNYEMKIIESDTNFNELGSYTYNANGMSTRVGLLTNIVKADDCFYFIGTKNLKSILPAYINDTTYISVICLDYSLNVIWEKDFGGDGSYLVTSVSNTQDNGCLILATKFIEEKQSLYVLKINKEGNIVTSTPVYNPQSSALVYPNPGSNQFNIKLSEYNQVSILNLYNISGKKVLSNKVKANQFSISTSHLPKGVYIYEITDNKNHRIQGKWVKQ